MTYAKALQNLYQHLEVSLMSLSLSISLLIFTALRCSFCGLYFYLMYGIVVLDCSIITQMYYYYNISLFTNTKSRAVASSRKCTIIMIILVFSRTQMNESRGLDVNTQSLKDPGAQKGGWPQTVHQTRRQRCG